MSAIQPKSTLEELAAIFANSSLKFDLKPFGEGSRLISKYRKSMNELILSDPYSAYMGLGVLSAYENNYQLASNYFESAQRLNPVIRSPKINISTTALLNGDLDKCVNTVVEALRDSPDDTVVVSAALRILSMFFYYDEIESLKLKYSNSTVFKEIENSEKNDDHDVKNFLELKTIDLSVLRSMQLLANQEFFSIFSLNSSFLSNYNVDSFETKFDEIIYIPKDLFGDSLIKADSIIYKMNESLQEKFVDLFTHYNTQNDNHRLLESFRNISIYFALDTRIKKS